MDADKENLKLKRKTRIPLPRQPLPALRKHFLKEIKGKPNDAKRKPLKTIYSETSVYAGPSKENVNAASSKENINSEPSKENINAGPSKENIYAGPSKENINVGPSKENINVDSSKVLSPIVKKQKYFKLDPTYVTMRQKNNDLDLEYKIFSENDNTSISSISDEEFDGKMSHNFADNTQRDCLGDRIFVVKPSHRRELEGLSPVGKHRLHFTESIQDRLRSPDYLKRSYMECFTRDYSAKMFNYLIVNEAKPLGIPGFTNMTRACVINWLMKINGPDGNPAVVQSACWFFDSIVATVHVRLDNLQLVAAACYWIARKLYGPELSATELVTYSKYAFTAKRLLAAEKFVLQKLKFPTQPVVAQDFINYFSWWLDNNSPGEIEVAATFLYMSGLLVDKELCEEFPSVIAAASVRNAVLLLEKLDLVTHLRLCPVYKLAKNKAVNLGNTCSILRRAVRTVAEPVFTYNVPYEHYGIPPSCIAQRIVDTAKLLSVWDTKTTITDQANIF